MTKAGENYKDTWSCEGSLTWNRVLVERDRANIQNFLYTSTVNALKVRILVISEGPKGKNSNVRTKEKNW